MVTLNIRLPFAIIVRAEINNLTNQPIELNNWFSTQHEYKGIGKAEFLEPKGEIEGEVTITVDETGRCSSKMNIETIRGGFEAASDILYPRSQLDTPWKTFFPGEENTCTKLTVNTPDGVFSAEGKIFISFMHPHIKFDSDLSKFDSENTEAKYWVLPLSNFLSKFRRGHPILDNHPLRIHVIPKFPNNLPENMKINAELLLISTRRNMILFDFKKTPGFIEPLPDYEEREQKLLNGETQNLITSVMVGEVHGENINVEALEKWLPFQFLVLLSLATGAKIGAPWIEFRNTDGALVRRIHYLPRTLCFEEGYKAIDEIRDHGIGQLLTQAQRSKIFANKTLKVVTEFLVDAGLESKHIEDKLTYLYRAMDTLCGEWKYTEGDDPKKILSKANKAIMKQIKNQARKSLSESLTETMPSKEKEILNRIGYRIDKLDDRFPIGFGYAIARLLEDLGLHDAKALAKHFQSDKKWLDLLSKYRGTVIHTGYFRIENSNNDPHKLYRFTKHLHDLLIRILLKMWNYNGTYQSTLSEWIEAKSLDWVTEDTPAEELGY